ncbi:MAG: replication-associated recombination protein A [Pseudobdellovibrionaceae bacterium]
MDLFTSQNPNQLPGTPLAERMRPQTRQELLGQPQVQKQVERYVRSGYLPSLILWGPPGTGKTTLAQALAREFKAEFVAINAVESGAKALKEIGEAARLRRLQYQTQTILFVDEIHRFNKAQQDVLLPFVEKGEIILIGATTENPSYELNRALLSRCRLVVFQRHDEKSLLQLLQKALERKELTDQHHPVEKLLTPEAQALLIEKADGDARRLLLGIEEIFSHFRSQDQEAATPLSAKDLQSLLGQTPIGYDRQSDQHYDVISAFIKSIRGSDADAALYYLARMLKGGEDPVFIARRLVILASEDVGNADPRALQVSISGAQAVELVGLPEGAISLAQVVTYLASAPKSNRSYMALRSAQDFVERTGTAPVPLHLRSSKTVPMKELGYGQGYKYPHDYPKHWTEQNYWPENLTPENFYQPDDIGFEKQILEYRKWLKNEGSKDS